jgi:hypothetical protein
MPTVPASNDQTIKLAGSGAGESPGGGGSPGPLGVVGRVASGFVPKRTLRLVKLLLVKTVLAVTPDTVRKKSAGPRI